MRSSFSGATLAPLSPKIRTKKLFTRIKLTPNFWGEGLGVRGFLTLNFLCLTHELYQKLPLGKFGHLLAAMSRIQSGRSALVFLVDTRSTQVEWGN